MAATALAVVEPQAVEGPLSLDQLAASIRREHGLCVLAVASALEHAISAGEALLAARQMVPRGEWEPWVEANCPSVARQARAYMRVASYRDAITPGVGTLTDALKSLRGLPAFDGTGPQRHPPELRERALELVGQGLSQRLVASMLNIDRKCVQRWARGTSEKPRTGNFRPGRPSRAEQKERARLVASERIGIGPAALANSFRAVWEARKSGDGSPLIASLRELTATASAWADQLEARSGASE